MTTQTLRSPSSLEILTVRDVAQMLKVSPRTVLRLPIRYAKIGKLRRYRREDVVTYVEAKVS